MIVPPKRLAKQFAPGGSRCAQPVGLIDLYPTLAEACNVPSPKHLDGQSLLPLLREPAKATGRVLTTTFDQGNVSHRTTRWRYLRYANGEEELYDLRNDPNEWTNLAAEPRLAEIKSRLAKRLAPAGE